MHPLDGPRLRIAVASRQIYDLATAAQRFVQEHAHTIPPQKSRKPGQKDFRLLDIGVVPPNFSIAIGQIAHVLRASLDELVCQLALKCNPGRCIDDICVNTGFPIRIHGPKTAKSKRGSAERRFSWESGHIKPLPRRLKAAIEALQPYKRGRGYRKNLLWLLEKLNNTDKHRMLVLLIQKAHGTSITVNRGKIDTVVVGKRITMYTETGQLEIIPRIKLKEGTKVAHLKGRLPDGVNVGVVIAPTMVFGDACRAVESLPVFPTLGEICNHVSDVVESFAPEFSAT